LDQEIRNKLRNVVTQCRKLLEDSVSQELEGKYGIFAKKDQVTADPNATMTHLTEGEQVARKDILAHFGHIKARGFEAKESLDQLVREIAFTHLNRLCAYKTMEAREVYVGGQRFREAVSRGINSNGVKFYLADNPEEERLFNTGHQDVAYRHFLDWLGSLLSEEIGVLFNPNDPANRLYPRQKTLDEVLSLLNGGDIKPEETELREAWPKIWSQDETIGWVYQYFTPKELRDKARKESAAPRNSYELAFRNQFFTPRYVVEFLTDNTLGRTWYEMRKGDTKLKDQCRYLVRRPTEFFLKEGEQAPNEAAEGPDGLSKEALLNLPIHIPHRPKKDPRDLKILDPACGSGHFLLYCFDLLLTVYEEAYADPDLGPALTKKTLEDFRQDVPGLILAHNLHGIDIDLRASQIASLALWLRCQRDYQEMGLKKDRPKITRSNFVCAEPMPGEEQMLKEFVGQLEPEPRLLGQLVEAVFDKMKLAGEAGALLKIEEEIRDAVSEAKKQWLAGPVSIQQSLFDEDKPTAQQQRFDFSGVTDAQFFEQAEGKVVDALRRYAEKAQNGHRLQRRLFADDAVRGFAFLDLCQKRYDVVLMNPPFGEPIKSTQGYLIANYSHTKHDLFAAFCERAMGLLNGSGMIGEISSRVGFFIRSFEDWRNDLLDSWQISLIADLGSQVLDTAAVEAACYVIARPSGRAAATFVFRLLVEVDKASTLIAGCKNLAGRNCFVLTSSRWRILPLHPFIYWIDSNTLRKFTSHPTAEPAAGVVRQGLATGNDFRFVRGIWEVPVESIAGHQCVTPSDVRDQLSGTKIWAVHVRAGTSQPWYSPFTVVVDWEAQGKRLKDYWRSKGESPSRHICSEEFYFRPGISWTLRAFRLIPYIVPAGCVPSASRYMAFPDEAHRINLLGLSASMVATLFMRFYGESFERPKHLVETFKKLPFAPLHIAAQSSIASFATSEVSKRKQYYGNYEPFPDFVFPASVRRFRNAEDSEWNLRSLLGESGEASVASAIGLNDQEVAALVRDLDEAIYVRRQRASDSDIVEDADAEETGEVSCDSTPRGHAIDTVSYAVGCLFGRWDIRMACDQSLVPVPGDPFLPIQPSAPGMLVGPDGLPGHDGYVASPQWLRSRHYIGDRPPILPESDALESAYPLRIEWDGIIVDDPDHVEDIVRRIQDAFEIIWPGSAESTENDICSKIGAKGGLREFLRRAGKGGFWQEHVFRYSKSRRKAPIYWLLQSSGRNYALWLYYHRLDKDLLFKALVNYVEPKIRLEHSRLETLRSQLAVAGESGKEAKRLARDVERQEDFLSELRDFEDKLRRAANLHLEPDLNDGVVLNIAPLHELVPWKEAKNYWDELLKGGYEWSSIGKQLRQKGMVK